MKKSKILFIDDDRDFVEANKIILNNAGYEVIPAYDGKTGMQKAINEKPDLIILDVILPDINGFSVCREIKEDPNLQNIPVILFTSIGAKPGGYPENIGIQHKADAYIEKPASPELLLEKVTFLLTTSAPKSKIESEKPKILLVDDDPDFLEATKQILLANRFEVITAKDGDEGIQKARIENPDLIKKGAVLFGSQCIVVSIDAKRIKNRWHCYTHGGRFDSKIDVIEWAKECEKLGAGEILLNSIDRDGTKMGYDIELTRRVSSVVKIPVIASGGAGNLNQVYEVIKYGKADAVLLASVLHFKKFTIKGIKKFLLKKGVNIRW